MSELPLLLSGPIVRDVSAQSASFWFALSKACDVQVDLYSTDSDSVTVSGVGSTVTLATKVHIVVVTVPFADQPSLSAGKRLYYDAQFTNAESASSNLFDAGTLSATDSATDQRLILVYPGQTRPSFRIPPTSLVDWRIAHASCRKPHGGGKDAYRLLDEELDQSLRSFDVLFLTGDQIYADDVHPALLDGIHRVADHLAEAGDFEFSQLKETYGKLVEGGNRTELVKQYASFSSDKSSCHLITFMEFISMYLLVWSDVLWEFVPPSKELDEFQKRLPVVRRVLANTPTYMVFDDHEITDDWNRSGAWKEAVTGSALGMQIITNGLCAYNLFQHWGNVPERFSEGSNEHRLVSLTKEWVNTATAETPSLAEAISESMGVENSELQTLADWSYQKDFLGYRLVALDTRTRREYQSDSGNPGLMTKAGIDSLLSIDENSKKPLIVLSPAPVLGLRLLEGIQSAVVNVAEEQWGIDLGNKVDLEAWGHDPSIHEYLLHTLWKHERVVVLSGDVHYAFGSTHVNKATDARIVNYISSSAKNLIFGSAIGASIVAAYLTEAGGATLESNIEDGMEATIESLDSEFTNETTTSYGDEWVEELIYNEPAGDGYVTEGTLESADPASQSPRDAIVVGSNNVGLVSFDGSMAVQQVVWKMVFKIRTRHDATFSLTTLA